MKRITPGICKKCNNKKHNKYYNIREVYNMIFKRCECTECGQQRDERFKK